MSTPGFVRGLERRARRARLDMFLRLAASVRLNTGRMRILDVGGTAPYWSEVNWGEFGDVEIVLLNVFEQKEVAHPFQATIGDARDLSRYADREFDIVYSNSVISLVGAWHDQLRMAAEVRRVGRRYFVQTPNRRFVLDWRTLVPFFHLLPPPVQAWCFQRFPVGTYPRLPDPRIALECATRVRDLTAAQISTLFPDGTIVRERIFGLTKSFIVHSGFE